jgi:hypothetical protein
VAAGTERPKHAHIQSVHKSVDHPNRRIRRYIVLRWRRLKLCRIRARALEGLEDFLRENLEYRLYRKRFADELTAILVDNLAEDQAEDAQTLAHACAGRTGCHR